MKLRKGELQIPKNGKLFVKVLMSNVAFFPRHAYVSA